MHIGICKITLRLPENQNLKGKRRIINSLSSRLKNQFNISIAEIDNQDLWQLATLGIVTINSDSRFLQQTLAKIMNAVEEQTGEFELLNIEQEIIHGG